MEKTIIKFSDIEIQKENFFTKIKILFQQKYRY